jgi:hypothetical protein
MTPRRRGDKRKGQMVYAQRSYPRLDALLSSIGSCAARACADNWRFHLQNTKPNIFVIAAVNFRAYIVTVP